MTFLGDLLFNEITSLCSSKNEPSYRAKQLFAAIASGKDFLEMTNVGNGLKDALSADGYGAQAVTILKTLVSSDGTEKYLYSLFDGNVVEGVLMRYKYGNTLCVSTQVGCRMHCAFCASGLHGLVRNLSAGEIAGQVYAVNRKLGGGLGEKRQITNLVLMGSGEPFDNYDNVVRFLRNISDPNGIGISPRNISLSTSGLVPKMLDFIKEDIPLTLTVSLHSPFDEERQTMMPVAKAYSIAEILSACDKYFEKTKRRFVFEYVLIRGKNDDEAHAKRLVTLLSHRPCHVNLIRLNPVKENGLSAANEDTAKRFLGWLTAGGLSATIRRQMGVDIDGACGQLRQKYLENNGLLQTENRGENDGKH